ncbi:hypothetical protein BKA70DRAFT_736529 [Coprinopsis sp. MPI-PUGE-AT-0042]|nr:hypothetical protein BKA70DRAFT_736529 [Coprinopsis sp. MPI-PUGE-AT-0042]
MSTLTSSVQASHHPSSIPTGMPGLCPFAFIHIENIATISIVGTPASASRMLSSKLHSCDCRTDSSFRGHLTLGPSGYASVGYDESVTRRRTRHNAVFRSFEVEQLVFTMDDLWKHYAIPIPPRRSSSCFTNGITTASSVPAHVHGRPSWSAHFWLRLPGGTAGISLPP